MFFTNFVALRRWRSDPPDGEIDYWSCSFFLVRVTCTLNGYHYPPHAICLSIRKLRYLLEQRIIRFKDRKCSFARSFDCDMTNWSNHRQDKELLDGNSAN